MNYLLLAHIVRDMSDQLDITENTETHKLIKFATQETRFELINNILRHPEQMPTIYELREMATSVSDATVDEQIQNLINAGIVREVALKEDDCWQGYSWKFYVVTEEGRKFLKDHSLLGAEESV